MIRPSNGLSAPLFGAATRAKDAEFEEDMPRVRNREVSAMTIDKALFLIETSVRSHERV